MTKLTQEMLDEITARAEHDRREGWTAVALTLEELDALLGAVETLTQTAAPEHTERIAQRFHDEMERERS